MLTTFSFSDHSRRFGVKWLASQKNEESYQDGQDLSFSMELSSGNWETSAAIPSSAIWPCMQFCTDHQHRELQQYETGRDLRWRSDKWKLFQVVYFWISLEAK